MFDDQFFLRKQTGDSRIAHERRISNVKAHMGIIFFCMQFDEFFAQHSDIDPFGEPPGFERKGVVNVVGIFLDM